MIESIEINPLVVYLFIALAFCGGFFTCAILAFGRWRDASFDVEQDQPEIDTRA